MIKQNSALTDVHEKKLFVRPLPRPLSLVSSFK